MFWARTLRGWDLAFYGMVAIAAVAAVLTAEPGRSPVVPLVALGGLVAAYALLGRRAAQTGSRRLALVYLAVLIALTVVVTRSNPSGSILLFLAYSQIWFFAETRRLGVAACVVQTIGVFWAVAAAEGFDPAQMPAALSQSAVALVFAILLGLWITQVAEQSEQRGELLIQLEDAQAELGRSQHAAGVAAERERLAQEIHDTLAQGFTSVIMLAQAAGSDLRREQPARAAERLALIEATARDNLAEARALVAAFAPVALDGSSLAEALDRLAHRFSAETGVQVSVAVPTEGTGHAIGREREVILLRAAQEALSNVRRHAGARHVQLVLADVGAPGEGAVQLEVIDDGRGIDAGAAEGFGLRGMRDRVTSGGGELVVTSGEQGGTRVRVLLPAGDRGVGGGS